MLDEHRYLTKLLPTSGVEGREPANLVLGVEGQEPALIGAFSHAVGTSG